MTQKVRIRKCFPDGTAEVFVVRESACSGDCHKCSGCGAAKETVIFSAGNPIGAQPGDLVNVETQSGPILAAAAVLYMVPLLMFFVGYFIGDLFGCGGVVGGAAFGLSIGLIMMYDRFFAKKKEILYTITGYAQ